MSKRTLLVSLFIYSTNLLYGQNEFLQQSINTAQQYNLTLEQERLRLQKSELKLSELRAKKLPKLEFNARYSRAFGGRTFEIPVGDLLNPVYQNLTLLNQQFDPTGGVFPDYPILGDEVLSFLRNKEQDTHLRVTIPIFNPTLNQGKDLQKQQVEMAVRQVALSKQNLSYEVKEAYYNYLRINGLQEVFLNAQKLAQTNLKTTKSLEEHHKVTLDKVYLAEAEIKAIEKELATMTQKKQTAQAYFNTLLNQPYTTPIPVEIALIAPFLTTMTLENALQQAKENRLEIRKMDMAKSITDQQLQAKKAAYLPQLNLVGQYGIQGTAYRTEKEDDYAIGSLVLSWTIFAGDKKHQLASAKIDQIMMGKQKENLQNQIELQVIDAFYALETAKKNQVLVKAQADSATKGYQLIHKKFVQGQANLIEITNARTQVTNAEQAIILAEYEYWLKTIAFEQAIGK